MRGVILQAIIFALVFIACGAEDEYDISSNGSRSRSSTTGNGNL
jgi:hypothetical protein